MGPSNSRKFIWPNYINSGCFQLHISQNVARLIFSLTSQSCGDSLLAVCLTWQVGAIYRPPKHQWTPDRPMNEASVKVDRWTFGNGTSRSVSLLLYLSNGGEKCDLKLCAYLSTYKTLFGKSSDTYTQPHVLNMCTVTYMVYILSYSKYTCEL